MQLKTQRRLAATLLKCGSDKVHFDPRHLQDVKEAITKSDLRLLITDGVVTKKAQNAQSNTRSRQIKTQKRKGLRRGAGSRKGTPNATVPDKERWMAKVRSQRKFLEELKVKGLVSLQTYRNLYRKSKGGFFRNKRHIKLYLDDQRLWQAPSKKATAKKE